MVADNFGWDLEEALQHSHNMSRYAGPRGGLSGEARKVGSK